MTIGEVFLGIFSALSWQPNTKINIKKIFRKHTNNPLFSTNSPVVILLHELKKIVEKQNWGFRYCVSCTDAIADRNGMDNHGEEKGWSD